MSIPANKADNKTPAYDIKLKRTTKTRTDATIKDGVLADGEPLVNKTDATLSIGDGTTTVQNLPVVHFITKDLSEVVTYYNAQTNNMVTLKKEDGTTVYTKTKFWTVMNSSGASKDAGATNNDVKLDFSTANGWQIYNASTSQWTSLGRAPVVSDTSQNCLRQQIAITGLSSDDKICISLCLTNAQLISVSSTKQAEKCFSTINAVESDTNCIYVYCKKVRENMSCYLNVFGG